MTSEEYGRRFFEQVAEFDVLDVYTSGIKPKVLRNQEPRDPLLLTYLAVTQNAAGLWEVLPANAGANYLNTMAINGEVEDFPTILHSELAQITLDFLDNNRVVTPSSYFSLEYAGQRYIAFPAFALDTSYVTGENPIQLAERLASSQIHVSLFKSSDGARIDDAFQRVTNIKPREMIFFMETDDGANLFGSVFRIRAGSGLSTRDTFPYGTFLRVLKDYRIVTTQQQLKQQVNDALRYGSTEYSLLPAAVNSFIDSILVAPSTSILDGVAQGFEAVSSWTGELLLGPNTWNRIIDGEINKEYDPLIPQLDLTDKAEVKKMINLVIARMSNTLITPLGVRLEDAMENIRELPDVGPLIVKRLEPISDLLDNIPSLLVGMVDVAVDALATGLEFLNAFLAGLLNTVIELFKFVFDIIAMLFRYMSTMTSGTSSFRASPLVFFSFFFESLENIVDAFANIFTIKNFNLIWEVYKSLPFVLADIIPLLWDKMLDGAGEVYAHDLGYYLGYTIGWLAQEIAGVMLTGGAANVAKAIKIYFASYKTLLKEIAQAAERGARATANIVQGAAELFLDGVATLRYYSRRVPELVAALTKWLDDIIKALKANIDVLLAKYKAAVTLLSDLGVIITRNIDQNLFPELAARGLDGQVYAIYNKVPIFSGTDDAFGAFAKNIDQINANAGGGKRGRKAVGEYLDEVAINNKVFDLPFVRRGNSLLKNEIDAIKRRIKTLADDQSLDEVWRKDYEKRLFKSALTIYLKRRKTLFTNRRIGAMVEDAVRQAAKAVKSSKGNKTPITWRYLDGVIDGVIGLEVKSGDLKFRFKKNGSPDFRTRNAKQWKKDMSLIPRPYDNIEWHIFGDIDQRTLDWIAKSNTQVKIILYN